jgi:hypothetical protein
MPQQFEMQAANNRFTSGEGTHLMPQAKGKERVVTHGGLKQTLNTITKVTRDTLAQTADLAKQLKGSDAHTSARNVWSWVKSNIRYHLDHDGLEEVRTPARSYADRNAGVDCEDMAIFTASLLINMGYKPHFAVVAFNHNESYGHIYTMLNSTVIDCVWTAFDQHPPNVTKTLNVNPMEIKVLSGTDDYAPYGRICGLCGVAPVTATTHKVKEAQKQLLERHKSAASTAERLHLSRELRKTQYIVNLNATTAQARMLPVMPALQDVTAEGEFVFYEDADLEQIAAYLDGATDTYEYIQSLDGLGSWLSKTVDKVKSTVKTVAEKAKDVIDKVKKPILKFMPLSALARNAFLLLVKLNVRNIAKGFSVGYYTEAEAKAKGIPAAVHARCVAGAKKMEDKFENFGGEAKNFRKEVERGAKKKALFGKSKSTKSLKGWGNDMPHYSGNQHSTRQNMPFSTAHGHYSQHYRGVDGLGEPASATAITTAITAAAPLLIALAKILKDMKPAEAGAEYDADADGLETYTAGDLPTEAFDEFGASIPTAASDDLANAMNDDGTPKEKDNKIFGLPPAIALGGGGLAAYMLMK